MRPKEYLGMMTAQEGSKDCNETVRVPNLGSRMESPEVRKVTQKNF